MPVATPQIDLTVVLRPYALTRLTRLFGASTDWSLPPVDRAAATPDGWRRTKDACEGRRPGPKRPAASSGALWEEGAADGGREPWTERSAILPAGRPNPR